MDLLNPQSGTIFWTALTFIILLIVLRRYAWGPILKTLEERENRIKDALDQAETSRTTAMQLKEEQEKSLKIAREESVALIEDSKVNAEKISRSIIEEARKEADNLLNKAREEIMRSKMIALDELKQYAIDISLAAAQKVTSNSLSEKDHLKLIENSLDEFVEAK